MEERERQSILTRLLLWLRSALETLFGAASGPRDSDAGPKSPDVHAVFDAQVGIIRDVFGDQVAIATDHSDDVAQYLYRAGHVLVASSEVAELRAYFQSRPDLYADLGDHPSESDAHEEAANGLTVLPLPARLDGSADPDQKTLADIDAALGAGVVTPDHLLYLTLRGFLCPATEPDAPNRDLPWPRETRDSDRGAGVVINVVDTGWWKPASQDPEAPWLANGVDGDAEQINPAAIHPYGGHGTFVAGVIRCQAPQAEIYVDGMLTKGGAIFESELMKQLDIAVLSGDAPNIVSISGGTHTYNDQPLMTFEHLARKHNLIDNPSAPLIVAAAGNDSTDAPFWPAAFDWVVGVGSLDRNDTVSDYSNHGDWVDIYALGRDHVNVYPTGTYTCYEPPNVGEVRQFKNLAKWSGTSFSTPLITGLIAGIMTEHGLTAHEAWARLKEHGIPRTDPNVGDILTVDTPGD